MSSVVVFVLCSKCQGLKIRDIRKTHMATRFTLHMALKNNNTSRKLPRVQRKTGSGNVFTSQASHNQTKTEKRKLQGKRLTHFYKVSFTGLKSCDSSCMYM